MPRILLILPFLLTLISACNTDMTDNSVKRIVRLDLATSQEGTQLTATEQQAFDAWIEILGKEYSRESYAQSPAVKSFQPLITDQLPPLDSIEKVLSESLPHNITVVGIVSPFKQSVITHPNGFAFIGLNHYLGENNPIYAGVFTDAERSLKNINRLPIDVTMAVIVDQNPITLPSNPTLLNHLLCQGAILQAALNALPTKTTEYAVLGISQEEYTWCNNNESNIWKSIISQGLLYSSDRLMIDRLLKPNNSTPIISANAPGQAALYIALKIVQSYLDNNPSKSANDLLNESFYGNNKSLIDSKYSPS